MTAGRSRHVSRRSVLLLSATGLLTGCAPSQPQAPATPVRGRSVPTTGPREAEPSAPQPRQPAPVDVAPYQVLPGEVEPAVKVTAVRAIEAALTWRDGPPAPDAARARVHEVGARPGALDGLSALLEPTAWSSVRVVYPQYGGLVLDRGEASVMVACQQLLPPDAGTGRAVTVDARLVRRGGAWEVTELLAPEPPAPAPAISAAASSVLADDRVVLPAAARSDVLAGLVDDVVLAMLAELSTQWRLDVLVLTTGHPVNVFGTDRLSNHTRGRAVDVWAIDGIPVIDQARAPWRAVMEAAADLGATEIGGPQDVDGVPGLRPYFSDLLHQDHLHLGFEGGG